MILADKIINLRKKNGWSQEELAEKLGVSRQSVSKWEGAQAIPDLNKIILMSQIFQVSTDYLLKDELEEVEFSDACLDSDDVPVRTVTMEETNRYLKAVDKAVTPFALAVDLCILSPVCLIMLGALSEMPAIGVSENMAAIFGITVLLVMVAIAVAIFIYFGSLLGPYEYLEKEIIETAYGVSGMVKQKQEAFKNQYNKQIIIGVIICILSAVPIIVIPILTEDDGDAAIAICTTLAMVAFAVFQFITASMPWNAFQRLLQEGDFTPAKKAQSKKTGPIATVYWLIVVAIFFGYSFITDGWGKSWIIWPVAGVLFAAVMIICEITSKKK